MSDPSSGRPFFSEVIGALAGAGVKFLLCDGVAAFIYGTRRATFDLDLVPRLDPTEWATAIDTLYGLGFRPRVPETRESIRQVENVKRWIGEKGMLALTFQRVSPPAEVDLLVSQGARYDELRARATQTAWGGVPQLIVSLEDLIAMKRASGRAVDLLDAEELEKLSRGS